MGLLLQLLSFLRFFFPACLHTLKDDQVGHGLSPQLISLSQQRPETWWLYLKSHTHSPIHNALPNSRPYQYYAPSPRFLFTKQNDNECSSLSLHLLAPERATSHPVYVSTVSTPFSSLFNLSHSPSHSNSPSVSLLYNITAAPSPMRAATAYCSILAL